YRLEGKQISLAARIVSIADAFDAMTSQRPYRRGMPVAQALSAIEDERGAQFDPRLADLFLDLGRSGWFDRVAGFSAEGRPLQTCPVCGPVIAVPHTLTDGD